MLSTIVLALLLPVQPQVSFGVDVNVEVPVPTVRFEVEPPLVVVAPGVVVVQDYDREVFFADGYYWTASDGVWYRTRSYRGGWVATSSRRVPVRISRVRHGSYRHFRGGRRYDRPAQYRRRDQRDAYRGRDRYDRRDVRGRRDHDRYDRRDVRGRRDHDRYDRRDVRDHRGDRRGRNSERGDGRRGRR